MNAASRSTAVEPPPPPITAAAGEIRNIPLDELRESPWNPRQYYPEGPMNELIQSMRESGFREWLPLMVRPLPDGGYEIGAGHRRSRAAREAGIETVPCVVRQMTDTEFLDVLNFDNSGREDVHPLHEASGWRAWMEKTGKGVLDIAARIGQSKEYVYQRLKYDDLIEDARIAFLDGKITAGHAILIARLQPADQRKALSHFKAPMMTEIELSRLIVEMLVAHELTDYMCDQPASRLMDLARHYKVDAAGIRAAAEEALKAAEGGTRREVEKPPKPQKPAAKKAPAASKPKPLPSAQHAAKKKAAVKKAAKPAAKSKGSKKK